MTDDTNTVDAALRDLAARVERNVPHHRDPERFHAEKSEIAAALRQIAVRRCRAARETYTPRGRRGRSETPPRRRPDTTPPRHAAPRGRP